MIYKCNQCAEFTAFNEKAVEQHKKEKHNKEISTPPPIVEQPLQISDQIPAKPEHVQPKVNKLNFMLNLKGKQVTAEGNNGKLVTGILKKFNDYELNIETDSGMRTVFKHSLFMIYELQEINEVKP